jgi:hypothetical protein
LKRERCALTNFKSAQWPIYFTGSENLNPINQAISDISQQSNVLAPETCNLKPIDLEPLEFSTYEPLNPEP